MRSAGRRDHELRPNLLNGGRGQTLSQSASRQTRGTATGPVYANGIATFVYHRRPRNLGQLTALAIDELVTGIL
jgi:hypothetical protein